MLYSAIGESPSDCQIVEIVHYGNPERGFQRGQSDMVARTGARMSLMLTYAVTVYTASAAMEAMESGSSLAETYRWM